MSPILADAIDIPFVFGLGLAVLIPLMAFEIFAEAFILRSVWRLPFGHLCRFTLFANLWSLIAGIPTKILNSWLYSFLLPEDLPGFFARYSVAVGFGTLVYFGITIAIEGVYAFRWLRRNQHAIARSAVWKGILAANLATYAVLAPLHYFATRPMHQVHEFTQNTLWTKHASTTVLFTDQKGLLKSVHADGSGPQTLVPTVVRDYLVSTNLNVILYRGGDGNLHLYRRDEAQSNLVMQTHERFQMDQAAFSPSGGRVAFGAKEGNYLEVFDVRTKQRVHQVLLPTFSFDGPSLAWSDDEARVLFAWIRIQFSRCPGDSAGHDLEDCITRKHEWHHPIALFWPCRDGRVVWLRRLGPVLQPGFVWETQGVDGARIGQRLENHSGRSGPGTDPVSARQPRVAAYRPLLFW